MKQSLSVAEARKLVLHSQKLPPKRSPGAAHVATLSVIEHLGYIQIDTISVIERAHHHTLWSRNPRYDSSQLDQLVVDKKVFEYWSHAAAYLPMRDYRFSLRRKRALATGEKEHWYERDDQMIQFVLDRITAEGPLMARDFEHDGNSKGGWRAKPAKQALEYLFMQGDLMVPGRANFHKVYDLTERVLPVGLNTTPPTTSEYARHLITRYLSAHGLGTASEIAYLVDGAKPLVTATLAEMVSSGELLAITVADTLYHALPASLELLGKPLARSKLKILSPFDNLVIQRKRVKALFGFDYLIECYVPKAKRKYGYFSLPVLWDGQLVARMDCKVDRKESLLHINHFALEPGLVKTDAFYIALRNELPAFLKFNRCNKIQIHRTSPTSHAPALQSIVDDIT